LINDKSDFWVNLNGNCLDISILAWCSLYGDRNAEFKWQKLINNEADFLSRLYATMDSTEVEFAQYIERMRLYRDKCVAHRDSYLVGDPKIIYPSLEEAVKSASFLYRELVDVYPEMEEIYAYKELESFYANRLKMGLKHYKESISTET